MALLIEWRIIPGAENYEISNQGDLRKGPKIIYGSVNGSGYRQTRIRIDEAAKYVHFHTLVARAFLGPRPEGMVVDHIDCDTTNNSAENLRYITAAANVQRPWQEGRGPTGARHGRHTMPERSARGERAGTAKLLPADIMAARAMRAEGMYYHQIAAALGISKSQAFNITTGHQWKHL